MVAHMCACICAGMGEYGCVADVCAHVFVCVRMVAVCELICVSLAAPEVCLP